MANFLKNSTLNTKQLIAKKTFISFFLFALLVAVAVLSWNWLQRQPLDGGILGGIKIPLRKGHQVNEKIFGKAFSADHLVKEYPRSDAAKQARVNGDLGLNSSIDISNWKLLVVKTNGDTLFITLDEIKKLPKVDVIYNFKCIEGWSQVTWWSGVRLADFMEHYGLKDEEQMKYVGLFTPDEEYYVGIDMPSALHSQTILCYELNGKPLPANQGYPLRLIIPVKYGIKSIKRIGTIYFDNDPPPDYWAERGYDYYSGL